MNKIKLSQYLLICCWELLGPSEEPWVSNLQSSRGAKKTRQRYRQKLCCASLNPHYDKRALQTFTANHWGEMSEDTANRDTVFSRLRPVSLWAAGVAGCTILRRSGRGSGPVPPTPPPFPHSPRLAYVLLSFSLLPLFPLSPKTSSLPTIGTVTHSETLTWYSHVHTHIHNHAYTHKYAHT